MLDFSKLTKGRYASFEQQVQGTLSVLFQGNRPKTFDVAISATTDGFEAVSSVSGILKVKKDSGADSQ